MNRRLTFQALAAAAMLTAVLGTARADWKPTAAPECAFLNRYLWRGIVLTAGPVAQPTMACSLGPFEANIWANMDLDDANGRRKEVTEVDYTGKYSHTLAGADCSAGVMTYTFTQNGVNSTTEVFAGVTGPWSLAPSITANRDVDQSHGTYLAFGLAPSIPAGPLSIDTSVTLGWGTIDHNTYNYGVSTEGLTDAGIVLSSDIAVHRYLVLRPTLGYARLIRSQLRDAAKDPDNVIFGLTVAGSF
jgi:hypothetical protein